MRNAGQPQPGTPEDFDTVARRYWSAWSDALRNAMPSATPVPEASPWQQQIDWWTTMAKGGAQPATDDTLDRFNAQARQWFGTMQQVAGQFAGRDAGAADIASAWRQAMAGAAGNPLGAGEFGAAPTGSWGVPPFLQGVGAMPGMDANPFAALLQGMQQGPGMHGFEHWFTQEAPWLKTLQGGASSMPSMPDMASFFQSPDMPHTPTFGHNRERDARWQSLARAIGELQQRMQAYAALMQRATQDAFAVFERKLAEHEAPGRQLASARALFDVWIDAAEEAYARIALTDEFRSVYGALVDAQMRVRGGVQVEVEHACAQLGMPTRTELDGAHRKIVELERQMRRLRDAASVRDARAEAGASRRAPPPMRANTVGESTRDTADAASPGSGVGAAKASTVVVTKAVKKKAAKKTIVKKAIVKKTTAKAAGVPTPVATKAAPKKTATRKVSKATRAVPEKTATNGKAAAAPRGAKNAAATRRPAREKSAARARPAARRAPAKPAARRAAPAPTRTAAKRAPRPASRRGAISVFLDTPMPVAPASLKAKR